MSGQTNLKSLGLISVFLAVGLVNSALAEDVYYYLQLDNLKITNGQLPSSSAPEAALPSLNWRQQRNREDFMQPYATADVGTEIYVVCEGTNRWNRRWRSGPPISQNMANTHVAIRTANGKNPSGKLFVPKPDWSSMTRVSFLAPPPAEDQKLARENFLKAKEQHYQRLLELGIPGAAWFRHQEHMAQLARGDKPSDAIAERGIRPTATDRRRTRESQLQQTYSVFSGGRAISENLQLDRELQVVSPTKQTVDINSIEGISTTKIDWKELVRGLKPQKDPLASSIPAEQHVLFFPSFKAMTTLVDEAKTNGTPVLRLLEPRAEDAQTQERYEHQLCLSLDMWTRFLGPKIVSSVAFTGSDPYLRTGSDVAVLFETVSPEALQLNITSQQKIALSKVAGTKAISGTIQNTDYSGVVSPDRKICSYMASIDKVVIVTNSLYQLEQIVKATKGQIPTIASLDEYTFFRNRYKLNDPEESALLILTDATIRRWCGPRWRIAASRRTRVAAVMAELQCRHLDKLASGKIESQVLALKKPIHGIGDLRINQDGIISSAYGTLGFLTPISEIPIDKVTPEESQAYNRFRRNYQRRWRQFFDPIAIRLIIRNEQIAVDITVRPLIASSEYRQFMEVTGSGTITPDAGDPHPETLLHYVMSLDPNSEPVRRLGNFAMQMAPGIQANALNWIGKWGSFYFEEDPFWQEFEKVNTEGGPRAVEDFLEKQFMRLPVALHIDVANPLKLTGFLVAGRAFIEQTTPGMTVWETLKYNDQPYVKVSPSVEARTNMPEGVGNLAVYYAATPKALVLTLNESILKRSLGRIAARRKAKAEGKNIPITSKPWLGKSVSIHAKKSALTVVQALSQESLDATMQSRAWGNIPILNEWRRRYNVSSPVGFHRRFWQVKLICPGGGEYVWNEEFQTMESTIYGHPGQPRRKQNVPNALFDITGIDMGLTFEDNGLRARAELARKEK